jgi:hypothetical protein
MAEDPLSTLSLKFPLDIDDVQQRHFVRFNIGQKSGALFDGTTSKNPNRPDLGLDGEEYHNPPSLISGMESASQLAGAAEDLISPMNAGMQQVVPNALPQSLYNDTLNTLYAAGITDTAAAQEMINLVNSGQQLAEFAEGFLPGDILDFPFPAPQSQEDAIDSAWDTLFGGAADSGSSAAQVAKASVESVPVEKDSLFGIGSFPGSQGGSASDMSGGIGGTFRSLGDIILYMPIAIQETYAPKWTGGELGLLGAAMQMSGGSVAGLAENWDQADKIGLLKGAGAEVAGKIAGGLLNNPMIEKKLLKMQGKAVNPHFELFFESVAPRTFTFNFKFAPRNPEESQIVSEIIRTFKMHSAPGNMGAEGAFRYWSYPNLFTIEYWNSSNLHRIKPCALTNITANYGASGTNHTFYDGFPIQTDMTLTFMENQLLTRGDFSKEAGY